MDEPRYLLARAPGPDRSWLAIGLVALAVLVAGTLAGAGLASNGDHPPLATDPAVITATPRPSAAATPAVVDVVVAWPTGVVLVALAPTPTWTPAPVKPTKTPRPLCPGMVGAVCWWATKTPVPTATPPVAIATAVPTCTATPQPGIGCRWTAEVDP